MRLDSHSDQMSLSPYSRLCEQYYIAVFLITYRIADFDFKLVKTSNSSFAFPRKDYVFNEAANTNISRNCLRLTKNGNPVSKSKLGISTSLQI